MECTDAEQAPEHPGNCCIQDPVPSVSLFLHDHEKIMFFKIIYFLYIHKAKQFVIQISPKKIIVTHLIHKWFK